MGRGWTRGLLGLIIVFVALVLVWAISEDEAEVARDSGTTSILEQNTYTTRSPENEPITIDTPAEEEIAPEPSEAVTPREVARGSGSGPVAVILYKSYSTQVELIGSKSFHPDGGIISYEWDFNGDGSTDSTAPNTIFKPGKPGEYEIKLKVTDIRGHTSTAREIITIEPASSPVS